MNNVKLLKFERDCNIGNYLVVNDFFILCGKRLSDTKKKELEKLYNVPLYFISCFGTELCGIFLTCNSKFILSPKLFPQELRELEKITEKHRVKLLVKEHPFNTYGNMVFLASHFGCVSKEYDDEFMGGLSVELNFPIFQIKSEKFDCVGALFREVKKNIILSHELEQESIKDVKKYISGVSSVNKGSPYLASGIVGNKYGLSIGDESSSVEIQNITENFEFV